MSLVNRATKGDNDPVSLLRQAGLSSMQKRAGYIVPVSLDATAHDLYWLCPITPSGWAFLPSDKQVEAVYKHLHRQYSRYFEFAYKGNLYELTKEGDYLRLQCQKLAHWHGDAQELLYKDGVELELIPLDQWPVVCAWAFYCDEMYYQEYGEK